MHFFRAVVGTAAVVLAGAAVLGKKARDKKERDELDAFLVPEQNDEDEDIQLNTGDDALAQAIYGLENHDPKTVFFIFAVKDADHAHQLQAMAADLEMASSYDPDKQTVEVEYKGNFDHDDLDLLNVQFAELCRQTDAVFESSHE